MSDVSIRLSDTLDSRFGAELEVRLRQLSALSRELATNMRSVSKDFSAATKSISSGAEAAAQSNNRLSTNVKGVSTSVTTLIARTRALGSAEAQSVKTKSELLSMYRSSATQVLTLKARIDQLRDAIRRSGKADGEKAALLSRLNKEQQRLGQVLRHTSSEISNYNKSVASTKTTPFRQQILDLSLASSLLGSRLGSATGSVVLAGHALKGLTGPALAAVAVLAGMALGLKATGLAFGAFIASVKVGLAATANEFSSFDVKITAANIAAGGTAATFELLSGVAKATALDFKFTSGQMSESLLTISRAGFTVSEQISLLPSVSALAAGGFASLSVASDLLTTTIRAFGLSASDADDVANAMVATVNNSKTSIEGIRSSFSHAAVAAAQFGVDVNELLTALAILADKGLKPSTQATGFRGMLAALSDGSEDLTLALETVGLTMDDVNIQTHGLEKVMRTLKHATDASGHATFDATAAFKGFSLRVAPVVLALIAGADGFGKFNQKVTGTQAAFKAAAAAMATLDGQMAVLLNTVENLKLSIGAANEGALKDLIKAVLDSKDQLNLLAAAVSASSQWFLELAASLVGASSASLDLEAVLRLVVGGMSQVLLIAEGLVLGVLQLASAGATLLSVMYPWIETFAVVAQTLNGMTEAITQTVAAQRSLSEIFEEGLAELAAYKDGYKDAKEAIKVFAGATGDARLGVADLISVLKSTGENTALTEEAFAKLAETMRDAGVSQEYIDKHVTLEGVYTRLKDALLALGLTNVQILELNLQEAKTTDELIERLRALNVVLDELEKAKARAAGPLNIEVNADVEGAEEAISEFKKEGDKTIITVTVEVPEKGIKEQYERTIAELEARKLTVGLSIEEEKALKRLKARLKQFEEEEKATVEVEADTLPAAKKVDGLLNDIKNKKTNVKLTIEEQKVLEEVSALLEKVKGVKGTLVIDANTAEALEKVKELIAEVEYQKTAVTIDADTVPASIELQRLKAKIESGAIQVDANTQAALDKLIEFEKSVNRSSPTAVVDADTKTALDKVNALKAIIEKKEVVIQVDADTSRAKAKLDALDAEIDRVKGKADRIQLKDGKVTGGDFGESKQSLEEAGLEIPYKFRNYDRFLVIPGPDGRPRIIPIDPGTGRPISDEIAFFHEGGLVGGATNKAALGRNVPGFGGGDKHPFSAPSGSFVLNKDSTQLLDKVLRSRGNPIMVEGGEKLLSPQEARMMGYELLEGLNNSRSSADIERHLAGFRGFSTGGTVTTANTTHSSQDNSSINVSVSPSGDARKLANAVVLEIQRAERLRGRK